MSWEDRLVNASFRGVEFRTKSHDARGGRRLVVHEFPGAEDPEVEDLGAKAWDWKLNAYFIGPDYDQDRDEFLDVLNQPGPDWLTHPWLGDVWVRAHDWSVHESNDENGYCTISVEFVPGGGTVAAAETDAVDVADDLNETLGDTAMDAFSLESMSFDGLTAFVATVSQKLELLRNVISYATLPLTWANTVMALIQGFKTDMAVLARTPTDYANAVRSLVNAISGGAAEAAYTETGRDAVSKSGLSSGTGTGSGAAVGANVTVVGATVDGVVYPASLRPRLVSRLLDFAVNPPGVTLPGSAQTDGVVRRNLIREEALTSRLLVTAAVDIALTEYQSEADRDAALESVIDAIDALLPAMPDAVFEAAVSARAAIIDALLAQDLKPTSTRDVVNSLPAVVLAHRLNVDESVFLARNSVRHPLFVKGRVYG